MHPVLAKLEQYNNNEYELKIKGDYKIEEPEKLVVRPIGSIESYNSDIFSKAVLETLKENPPIKNIIIDLKEVPYMSSTGIGSIMQILGYVNQNKLKLNIFNVNEKIKETFHLIGFDSFFNVH
jgi:anti-sigma B factor antagonist